MVCLIVLSLPSVHCGFGPVSEFSPLVSEQLHLVIRISWGHIFFFFSKLPRRFKTYVDNSDMNFGVRGSDGLWIAWWLQWTTVYSCEGRMCNGVSSRHTSEQGQWEGQKTLGGPAWEKLWYHSCGQWVFSQFYPGACWGCKGKGCHLSSGTIHPFTLRASRVREKYHWDQGLHTFSPMHKGNIELALWQCKPLTLFLWLCIRVSTELSV